MTIIRELEAYLIDNLTKLGSFQKKRTWRFFFPKTACFERIGQMSVTELGCGNPKRTS